MRARVRVHVQVCMGLVFGFVVACLLAAGALFAYVKKPADKQPVRVCLFECVSA